MTAAPVHLPTAPTAPASRMPQRFMLAMALWLIWGTPLLIVALTGPKFTEIFREFGVKLGGGVMLALKVAAVMASPLGIAFMLLALPALCFAASTLILPPRFVTRAPGRPRWPLVVIAVVGSLVGAVALVLVYAAVVTQTLLPIIDKVQKAPPTATSTPPAAAATDRESL